MIKIISGGQTGVDQIGLKLAKLFGLETGGYAPKNYLTESGPNKDLVEFNLKEITDEQQYEYTKLTGKTDHWTCRTYLNVKESDGTVYFEYSGDPKGKWATLRSSKQLNKPFIENPTKESLLKFIKDNNIKVLNVAGNRLSRMNDTSIRDVCIILTETFKNIINLDG